ncbi:MAG: PAS domain S-box protein, partial [Desulfobacteraceae bacterium]|nr:PAS domain S-box protein [Desulfobacteraceae bacterium]
VTAYTSDYGDQFLLHVMTTASRVRGMFVGVLNQNAKYIKEASFELLSILLAHCSSTLESYELYHRVKESNRKLKEKVQELSISEALLKEEISDHQKTEIALKSSEKQYRLLTETAREMIITASFKGKITFTNRSALKLSGYSKKEMDTKLIGDLIGDFNGILNKKSDSGGELVNHDTWLITKSDKQIPIEVNMVSISEESLLIVARDIRERVLAENEKKSLESRLWQAQKMESIGLLASGIAHDFNNLLSGIIATTELAMDVVDSPEQIKEDLGMVMKASKRAKDLASKMYTIGRKDNHKTHLLDIVSLINETAGLVRSSIGKGKSVAINIEAPALFISAEETRIQQILINLITNASYSMGKKKGEIVVNASQVFLEDDNFLILLDLEIGNYIRISVKDTGDGIDPEIVEKIFDPYFTTKKGKDNAGLGLSVVHGIVKNY